MADCLEHRSFKGLISRKFQPQKRLPVSGIGVGLIRIKPPKLHLGARLFVNMRTNQVNSAATSPLQVGSPCRSDVKPIDLHSARWHELPRVWSPKLIRPVFCRREGKTHTRIEVSEYRPSIEFSVKETSGGVYKLGYLDPNFAKQVPPQASCGTVHYLEGGSQPRRAGRSRCRSFISLESQRKRWKTFHTLLKLRAGADVCSASHIASLECRYHRTSCRHPLLFW